MDSDTFINLITNNQEIFVKLNLQRLCKELRQNIYIFLISRKSEEDFFDITRHTKDSECLEIIYKELEIAGWKHRLSYGDTGLFIYRENVPKNCW